MLELLRHPTPELPCTLEEAELCARSVMTELLRHPTLELTCALGDDGAAAAPHTGADARARGADVRAW